MLLQYAILNLAEQRVEAFFLLIYQKSIPHNRLSVTRLM